MKCGERSTSPTWGDRIFVLARDIEIGKVHFASVMCGRSFALRSGPTS